MSLLSDQAIKEAMGRGEIGIEPFDRVRLGSNSYDLTFSRWLLVCGSATMDCRTAPDTTEREIPEDGYVLLPRVRTSGARPTTICSDRCSRVWRA